MTLAVGDVVAGVCAGVALVCGVSSVALVHNHWETIGLIAAIIGILISDGYVIGAQWCAAAVSSAERPTAEQKNRLPTRQAALLIVPLLAIALVTSFAALYLASHGVLSTAATAAPLKSWNDAIYFSVVTFTTLGYGDFVPHSVGAKWIAIFELGSGLLLLIGAFPLVIARISTWK
jgi:hypothetical protein